MNGSRPGRAPLRVPVLGWTREYRRAWLRPDVVAGLTVTAYLVPQVMAYAELAGLPSSTGLWAAIGALAAYAVLGSSRVLSVGPESTTALMAATVLASVGPERAGSLAVALALVVALVCLVGWVARLSFVAELLSRPVLVGYMAGVAVMMIVSQLPRLTGVSTEAEGTWHRAAAVLSGMGRADPATIVVAATSLAVMLAVSRWRPHAPAAMIGVLLASAAVALAGRAADDVALVGAIAGGAPSLGVPDVSTAEVVGLLLPALGVAFVGYTDNILTGRAFAGHRQETVDAQQELLALGAANLGAALCHGFPVSSSGSRTAIVDASGGRSQLAGVVTLVATLVVVLVAGPALALLPVAGLGAVVVYAALRLIDLSELRRFARFRRSELGLALATTGAVVVVDVLLGVLVAVGLSLADLLRRVARPHDAVEGYVEGLAGMHDVDDYRDARTVPGLVVYRYDSPLFFANAEDFRTRALAAVAGAAQPVRWLVLNTEAISEVDVTAVDALEALRRELEERGTCLALARVKQDLRDSLAPTGLLDRVGEDRIFPTLPTAVAAYDAWCGRS